MQVENTDTTDVVITDSPETKLETTTAPDTTAPNPLLEKALKEKRNYKTRVEELETQLQTQADEKLKANEDWKALYESTNTKLLQVTEDRDTQISITVDGHKTAALKKELNKLGAAESSVGTLMKLADLSTLKYDREHKLVLGAEDAAKGIYEALPTAFGKVTAKIDNDAPQTDLSGLDLEGFSKMSSKDRRNPDVQKRLFEQAGIVLKK